MRLALPLAQFLIERMRYNFGAYATPDVKNIDYLSLSSRSDFVYMAPPFIAYFGVLNGGAGELPLLQIAYQQCRLYREALQDPESGLWRHVVMGSWQDNTHWATG
jgi:rhamnogalacturonyl hydrolase YesR